MTSNKMMTTNTHDIPREPRLLTHGLRFTQEQLKNMSGIKQVKIQTILNGIISIHAH